MKTYKIYLKGGQSVIFDAKDARINLMGNHVISMEIAGKIKSEENPIYINPDAVEAITVTEYEA